VRWAEYSRCGHVSVRAQARVDTPFAVLEAVKTLHAHGKPLGASIRIHTDALALVHICRKGGIRGPDRRYSDLIRRVVDLAFSQGAEIWGLTWIPRELNEVADSLTRPYLAQGTKTSFWDSGLRSTDWGPGDEL
jgi:hypothetical protein